MSSNSTAAVTTPLSSSAQDQPSSLSSAADSASATAAAAQTTAAQSSAPSSAESSVQSSAESSAQSSFSSAVASSVSSEVLSAQPTTRMPSTTTVENPSTNIVTSTVSASSQPASTQLITSVITESHSDGASTNAPVTVVVTSVYMPSTTTGGSGTSATSSGTSSSASSTAVSLNGSGGNKGSNNSGGLSTGGKTAIAVVVPVVVVALLVLAGLFFWRKRKQRKNANEERRKEVEEYGFNPNNDPTLPVVAADGTSEMAEDHNSGYRGWGNTSMSNRKASTTLSNGHTAGQLSDSGSNPSNPGGYLAGSPTAGTFSDGQSGDNLMNRRETVGSSDDLGALGAAPVAGARRNDIRRGPSNASSSYSAGNHSEQSDHSASGGQGQSYSPTEIYGSGYGFQHGPYGDGTYGGSEPGMPVVRDVSARRNTRIEAGGSYQQGNSGIAQNF